MNRDQLAEKIEILKEKYHNSANKAGFKDSKLLAELSELRRQYFNTFE